MTSIRTRLLLGLMLALSLAMAVVLLASWHDARRELASLFDAHLQQSAAIMLLWTRTEPRAGEQLYEAKFRAELQSLLPLMTGVYQQRQAAIPDSSRRRELAYSIVCDPTVSTDDRAACLSVASPNAPDYLRQDAAAGFSELTQDDNSEQILWHIYTLPDTAAGITVRVAERDDVRTRIIASIVRRQFSVLLVLLPLSGVLAWLVIGHGLRPLRRLSAQINARHDDLLEPVQASAPDEVSVLVDALNQLFHKVAAALDRERRFSADVAHELRTPLSVIKTRADLVTARDVDTATASACAEIARQCQRATRVLDQLLQLARIEGGREQHWQPVDLAELAREVMADLSSHAQAHQVELELQTADQDSTLSAEPISLSILLRNLLDNAIRHSDAGSVVTVIIQRQNQRLLLSVQDQGPGLNRVQREQLQRFMRSGDIQLVPLEVRSDQSGYGLGLRIVQRIAVQHGAEVELLAEQQGSGLQVQVSLPLARRDRRSRHG